jgi:dihydrofolate reductase
MTQIYTGASMSLDGYISGPDVSGFDRLFAWYEEGDVEIPTLKPDLPHRVTPASAEVVRMTMGETGVFVVGRKLFDITNGWHGMHPYGIPVVVVTHTVPEDWVAAHPDAPFTFVTEGVERAIEVARGIAGEKHIGVNAGTVASQCLDLRLLDEVWLSLVPVVLGAGDPFFTGLGNAPFDLEGPLSIAPSGRVTHLRYRVRYAA